MNQIENNIIQYLEKDFGVEVTEDTPLFSSSLLHSLNVLQLITYLEKAFAIKIPIMEVSLETFDTVKSIVALVEKLQAK